MAVDEFENIGSVRIQVNEADRIIVGVLEEPPNCVALALGHQEEYVLMECTPAKARKIAASLLNKADRIEGLE